MHSKKPILPKKHAHKPVTEPRKGAAVSKIVLVAAKRRGSIQSANQRRNQARHDSRD